MARDYVLQPFRSAVDLQIDYRGELNDQQHAAVTAAPGPSLVIAGAGSGKTRTLTYRVAYLLEQNVPANRILLLTFTNKASKEMMERVRTLLGQDLESLWGGTFHSIGHRILRRHADLVGFQRDFTILDREDAKDLLKACIGAMDIDIKATRFPKPEVLGNIFSLVANMRQSVSQILEKNYPHFTQLGEQISTLCKMYEQRKQATNVMDFDDLQTLWLKLLKEHEDIRERYQQRFHYVLVDEYQDTNQLQCELIDIIAARHGNVMVVGDDSQSIYSWRGANFQNILEFPQRYPAATTYKIEVNYRSTPEILAVANAAIASNAMQFEKKLESARPSGTKPIVVACNDSAEQAAFVAQRVLELRDEGRDMNNMAVLYRSHFHALELQLELTRRNIPFSITSGIRFFEQAHIKDVAAYLKLVCNPQDEVSFKRIVLMLPGIGAKGADKLWALFHEARINLVAGIAEAADGGAGDGDPDWDVEDFGEEDETGSSEDTAGPQEESAALVDLAIAKALRIAGKKAPKKSAAHWEQMAETVAQLEDSENRTNPALMIELVLDAGYDQYLEANFANHRSRREDVEQLSNFAMQFKSVEEFLGQLALLTNVETEASKQSDNDDEQLKLSTIHQAKGLEFDVVFSIMLCDGLFPSQRSLEEQDSEEEERRLFYVTVTRAKDELYLSYPLMRMSHGYGGDYIQTPSRFLKEIPDELVEEWNLQTFTPYGDGF